LTVFLAETGSPDDQPAHADYRVSVIRASKYRQ
jgi:hypothetical protein